MTDALQQMTQDQAIKELITPNGKQVGIYHVKNTALYKTAFQSGGELPPELNGMFTDTHRAYEAARKYVERRWKEESERQARAETKREAEPEPAQAKKGPGRPKKAENANAEQNAS